MIYCTDDYERKPITSLESDFRNHAFTSSSEANLPLPPYTVDLCWLHHLCIRVMEESTLGKDVNRFKVMVICRICIGQMK